MDWNILLMPMLGAIFAMAGTQHLLVFMRNPGMVEHLWFGTASLAAAGAALVHCAIARGMPASGPVAQYLPAFFAAAWFISTAWFGVGCVAGGTKWRRIALLASLLIAIACVGDLAMPAAGHRSFPAWHLSSLAALTIMAWLAIRGALRLWTSARRIRAAALAGLAVALSIAAVQGALRGHGFPELLPPALCVFLVVVMLMAWEFANTVADSHVASRRQQQELAHASRLSIVGELTASVAHEINQPLGAILSNADAAELLLEHSDPPLDEVRQILADIRRDGLRASDVITHVRKLVRKRELELEKVDANDVAKNVMALLEPEARGRRVSITHALWPQPIHLLGDRALMEQVLINLVMNAMDAVQAVGTAGDSAARPPIVLGVSTTSHGEIEFRIADAGAGIPPERLDHLFDSFYTSKAHGMGLGLSIARSIVEAHGGRIRAQNNREAGATFRVTLPPFVGAGGGESS